MTFRTRPSIPARSCVVLAVGCLAAGGLALSGLGVGVGVAASAASPGRSTHTITIRAVQTAAKQFPHHRLVFTNRDSIKGRYAGNSVLAGVLNRKTDIVTGNIAIALSRGILYAHFKENGPTGALTGTVTGGAGAYHGISGTITGNATNAKTTVVTVTYRK
jgi:hypothetical protein